LGCHLSCYGSGLNCVDICDKVETPELCAWLTNVPRDFVLTHFPDVLVPSDSLNENPVSHTLT
jgi:hypothetical protein